MIGVEPVPETSGMERAVDAIERAGQLRPGRADRFPAQAALHGQAQFLRRAETRQAFRGHFAIGGPDDAGIGIDRAEQPRAGFARFVPDQVALV